jgi:hypothetical protein
MPMEFTDQEIEYYEELFNKTFENLIDSDNLSLFIQDEIRNLEQICFELDKRLKDNEDVRYHENYTLLFENQKILNYFKTKLREILEKEKNRMFTSKQIRDLYNKMEKCKYIGTDSDFETFKNILNDVTSEEGKYINWIDLHTNKTDYNKHTLFDFLQIIRPSLKSRSLYGYIIDHFMIGGKITDKNKLSVSYSGWNSKNPQKGNRQKALINMIKDTLSM